MRTLLVSRYILNHLLVTAASLASLINVHETWQRIGASDSKPNLLTNQRNPMYRHIENCPSIHTICTAVTEARGREVHFWARDYKHARYASKLKPAWAADHDNNVSKLAMWNPNLLAIVEPS